MGAVALYRPRRLLVPQIGPHWGPFVTKLLQKPAPTSLWLVDELSGTVAEDVMGQDQGTFQSTLNLGVRGWADGLNGISQNNGGYISTATQYTNPQTFTLMCLFKTQATTVGGLMVLASGQTGISGNHDRSLHLDAAGKLNFNVSNFGDFFFTSTASYNDGRWHLAHAAISGSSWGIYVDGVNIGGTGKAPQSFSGFWRLAAGYPTNGGPLPFTGQFQIAAVWNGSQLGAGTIAAHAAAAGVPSPFPTRPLYVSQALQRAAVV